MSAGFSFGYAPVRALLPIIACVVLGAAAHASWPVQDLVKPEEVRATIDHWVETRRLISAERRDWELGRGILADRIAVVEQEIHGLEARIAEAQAGISEADQKRAEILAASAARRVESARLRGTVAGFEERLHQLLVRLPEPIRERVRPFSQQVPAPGSETRLSVGERFQFLVAVMNEVDKFHRDVSLHTELRKLEDGRNVEVSTIYLGLGQAYYATANGTVAGYGYAGSERWEWVAANAAAPQILRAIAILKNEQVAEYVELPIRIQ